MYRFTLQLKYKKRTDVSAGYALVPRDTGEGKGTNR